MDNIQFPEWFNSATPFIASPDHMVHGPNYAFYLLDMEGKPAPTYYSQLISSARETVCIWDPYFNTHDTEIFSHLAHPVEVFVLTRKSSQVDKKSSYLDGLINETRNNINDSVKGNCDFFFGYIDTDIHGDKLWHCHDRFLIIDGISFFLIGASVASHLLPNFSTGIYEVRDMEDQSVIVGALKKTMDICLGNETFKKVPI